MVKYKRQNNKEVLNLPNYRKIFSVIILVWLLLSTFLVYRYSSRISGDSLYLFPNINGIAVDYFLFVKEVAIFICAIAIIVYFIGEKIYPDKPYMNNPVIREKKLIIGCGVYLLFVVISSLLSNHKEVVLWGSFSCYEGIVAQLSYVVIFLAGINYYQEKEIRSYFIRIITVYLAIVSLFAVVEYCFKPMVEWTIIKDVIGTSLNHNNEYREAVLTFYNSDYFGALIVLLFPLAFYFVFSVKDKLIRYVFSLIPALALIAGIMSNSTAATYILIAEVIAIVVVAVIKRLADVKIIIMMSVVLVALIIVALVTIGPKSFVNKDTYSNENVQYRLEDLTIEDNRIVFGNKDTKYSVGVSDDFKLVVDSLSSGSYSISGDNDKNLVLHDDTSDADITMNLDKGLISIDFGYKSKVYFGYTKEGMRYIGHNNELLDQVSVSSHKNSSFNSFATGRGFIWINSLDLMKNSLIVGLGSGNYAYQFDQNYVVDLLNTHGSSSLIVDKPHNFYIGVWCDSGLLSLIIVLVLYVFFIVKGLKVISNNPVSNELLLFVLLYVGILGFMISGLSNDSCIAVNPLFWMNFGIAYCLMNTLRAKGK